MSLLYYLSAFLSFLFSWKSSFLFLSVNILTFAKCVSNFLSVISFKGPSKKKKLETAAEMV